MTTTKKIKEPDIIKSVDHAFDVLEAFDGSGDELGVTELSKALGLSKNNVFRLLATFELRGYIEQNKKSENYRLGLKVFELGQIYKHQSGLLRQARPILKEMVSKCDESAYIAILRDGDVVYLDMIDTTKSIKVISRVGLRVPAYCTSIGKAQLAFESEDELDRIFEGQTLERFTDNTITEINKLKEELKLVAEEEAAIDNAEFEEEIKCVGVAVRDYTRRVVAGICISGPSFRMSDERIRDELTPLVKDAGMKISMKLGYPGD